jgi:DNA-binding NarL/FixJ family response regulator
MGIRVVIADDHAVVRLGIRKLLELDETGEIAVVGEVDDGDRVLAAVQALAPNVLLLDVMMPGLDVVSRVRQALDVAGGPRVLILTAYEHDELVQPLLAAGISGYLLKDEMPDAIVQAIRAVAGGQTWFSQRIAGLIVRAQVAAGENEQAVGEPGLTPREWEILQLIGQGKSNSDIAEHLVLSKTTVQNYVSSVYAKLGIETRSQALLYAMRSGLVDIKEVLEQGV